jgi:hypothetical protein
VKLKTITMTNKELNKMAKIADKQLKSNNPNYDKLIECGFLDAEKEFLIVFGVHLTEYQIYSLRIHKKGKNINNFKELLLNIFIEINTIQYEIISITHEINHDLIFMRINVRPTIEIEKPLTNFIVVEKNIIRAYFNEN